MRKLIATMSAAMIMGCALALAHADANDDVDTSTRNSNLSNDAALLHQQAGTADDNNMSTESTTTTTHTKSMAKKSCTNEDGKIILKGHTGYQVCLKQKKAKIGGVGDDSANKTAAPLDSNHVDNGVAK